MPYRSSLLAIAGTLAVSLAAQAASPTLSNVLPRGAQRGATVEVRLTGDNLTDFADVLFHQPGIVLTEIVQIKEKSVRCTFTIAPDCPLGRHALRIRTDSGLTNPIVFVVGALPEIEEQEPNNAPAEAQPVPLEVTVNGVVTEEDVDYFAVDLAEGARLAVEIEGIRLGHKLFDPKLRLFGPAGHELIAADDTPPMRQDAAFVFTAPQSGQYRIAVSEASYGGSKDSEYRLHIGTFPRPLAVTPIGGPLDRPIPVRWLGDPLQGETTVVPAVSDAGRARIEIVSPHGYAPTPLPYHASNLPTTLEPHDTDDLPVIPVPGAFEGVIESAGDIDEFAFDGAKGQSLNIQIIARSIGSPLDSVLEVRGPDGEQVLHSDDNESLDSGGRVSLPDDGRYTVTVRDHLNHGGETFAYRVEVAPPEPALWFTLIDNEPAALTVPQGNHAFLRMSANRRDFDAPLELVFEGLPEGVTARHDPVPAGATEIPVVFSADVAAVPTAVRVNPVGNAQHGDRAIAGGLDHRIPLVTGRNQTVFDDLRVDRLAMAVAHAAPFSLEIVPPKAPVPINGWCSITVRATRQEGFNDPIALEVPWKPKGIGMPSGTIPEGASETELRLEVYGGVTIGTVNLVVTGKSAGHLVSTPFTPVAVEDAWIKLDMEETQGEQGGSISWPATITFTRTFDESVTVDSNTLPKGVSLEPLQADDSGAIAFNLALAEDAPEGKQGPIGFITTVTVNDERINLRLGGATLKVFKPLPPQLAAPAPAPEPEPKADDAPVRRTRFPTEM